MITASETSLPSVASLNTVLNEKKYYKNSLGNEHSLADKRIRTKRQKLNEGTSDPEPVLLMLK
jgi:hypothetical protein